MRQKMRVNSLMKGPRHIIFLILFFMVSIAFLSKLTDYTRTIKSLNHSQFLTAVEQDKVRSVHINGQEVYGVMHDGTQFEAIVADHPMNLKLLRSHNVDIIVASNAGQFSLWHLLLLLSFIFLPLAFWYFFRQSKGSNGGGSTIFTMGKSRAKMFMPSSIKVTFDDVAGASQAKEELRDIVDFLKNPDKYRRLGAKIPRGVLLVGEPGNGKTLLAKAVAGEAHCPFFNISGSDFIEVFVGVGAARVRDLFAQARKNAPCIIFIDEIDAIGRQRGNSFGGSNDEREQALNQLLTEMDGFDTANSSIIVLAATNMPDVLDKALLRPGRFDRRIDVPFPDEKSRLQILSIHADTIKLDASIDLNKIAAETAGFSGADLANLVNQAAILASKHNKDAVGMAEFEEAHKMILQSLQAQAASLSSMAKGASKVKIYMPAQIKCTFADVAGVEEAKEELRDIVDFLKNPDKYKRLGAKITRGVLLAGDPGNGKTLLARAVAGEANCPFINVSASEFVEMYVGVGAARIRDLFAQARKHNPCIIFIDEIDAVGARRSDTVGGNEERNQTLNQLLTEMDGFDSDQSAVIVIAATNRPDILDKALLRPGRFDRRVEIPYPDLKSREKILRLHASKIKLDPSVDVFKIARGTPGFSGADLANLINEAAIIASKESEKHEVGIADIEEARDKIMLGKELKSIVLSDQEKLITAFHESGHALVRLLLPEQSDPLHKVTIIPRGRALGVTHSLPEREKYTQTKEEMLATIMVCLGGRAAEEIACNVIGTGASNDFEKATDVARKMVCHYGMSDELGLVVYQQRNGEYQYSERTAERIDAEVQRLLEASYKKVKELLTFNRDKLNRLADELYKKETLFAAEIYELLGITPREDFKLT
jgi:cell division protease FtsH